MVVPSSSLVLLLVLLFTKSHTSHAQGGARGDDDVCSNWNETAVALEAHNKTLQSALQQHSSCYNFEYTYFIYSPDPPIAESVQVRNGIAVNLDPTRAFNSILDVMDLIHAQCIEGCAEAIAAAAAADSEGTSTSTANTRAEDGETAVQLAHQCQVQFDDVTGVPTTVWVDRFSFLADEEYTYTIDNFQWVNCENDQILEPEPTATTEETQPAATDEIPTATDIPPEMNEPDTCIDYEQVKADLEAAREAWPDHKCYQFKYTQGNESVFVQVKDGVVVKSEAVSGAVNARTMNELMDDFDQLCVASCPDEGARTCSATFATEGYILSAFIDSSDAEGDEVSYEVTDFEVLDCNDLASAEGASSALSRTINWALVVPVALAKLLM